jgi:hypothetical protein
VLRALRPDRQTDAGELDKIFSDLVKCPGKKPSESRHAKDWWRGKVMNTKEVDLLQMTQVAEYHPFMAGILWNLDLNPLCNVFLNPLVREEVVQYIGAFFTDQQTSAPFISRIRPLEGLEVGWGLMRPIVRGFPPGVPEKPNESFGRVSYDIVERRSLEPGDTSQESKKKDVTPKKATPAKSKEEGGGSGGDDDDDDDFRPGAPVGEGARRKVRKLPDTSSSEDVELAGTGRSFSGMQITRGTGGGTSIGSLIPVRAQVAKKTTTSTLPKPGKAPIRSPAKDTAKAPGRSPSKTSKRPRPTGDTTEEDEPPSTPSYVATPARGRGRARTRGGATPVPGFFMSTARGKGRSGGAAGTPGPSSTPSGATAKPADFPTPKSTAKPSFQAVLIGGDGTSHCGDCNRSFQTIDECEEHIWDAHPDRPGYICKICGRGFGTRDSLYSHRNRAHSGQKAPPKKKEEVFLCPGCKKPYAQRQSRNRHKIVKKCGLGLSWGWQCPICKKTFPNQNTRNHHMNVDHPGQPKPGKDEGVVVVTSSD